MQWYTPQGTVHALGPYGPHRISGQEKDMFQRQ